MSIVKLVLLLTFVAPTMAFLGVNNGPSLAKSMQIGRTDTRLFILGPIQKMAKAKEYKKVVDTYMKEKGLSRAEAEAEYDKYLENPNDFMLSKRSDYYKDLGYKGFEDGVIGEAEKEGRGDEMREKLANFKRESKIKGFSVIGVFIALFAYLKVMHDADPVAFEQMLHGL